MPGRTITAFASEAGVEDVAAQVAFGARVLKAWGEKEIRKALDAGDEPRSEMTLNATTVDAQTILRDLGPLNATT